MVKGDGTENLALSSAGHCPAAQSYQGDTLYRLGHFLEGSQDVGWWDNANITWNKTFYVQPQDVREVYHVKSYSGMNEGDRVCKRGTATGYDCGDISDTTYCPSYVDNCNSTFVRAHEAGVDLSSPGDSGGPVFKIDTAWGLVSGSPGSNENDLLFMPQEYMHSLAIHVAIAPN